MDNDVDLPWSSILKLFNLIVSVTYCCCSNESSENVVDTGDEANEVEGVVSITGDKNCDCDKCITLFEFSSLLEP